MKKLLALILAAALASLWRPVAAVVEQKIATLPAVATETQQAQTRPAAAGRIAHQKVKYFI